MSLVSSYTKYTLYTTESRFVVSKDITPFSSTHSSKSKVVSSNVWLFLIVTLLGDNFSPFLFKIS